MRSSRIAVIVGLFASSVVAATVSTRADGPGPQRAGVLPNPFFAMDTGTRDAAHDTPEAQAALLAELGYAGIGGSPSQVPDMLRALDRHGLKMFTVYLGIEIGGDKPVATAHLKKLIDELKGRDTIVWLTIASKKHKPSDPAGDDEAVAVLREISGWAKAAGVKVALYPHTWMWVERVQDAVRLAKKVGRDNLGATFNLCHCLKVGDQKKIPTLLQEAIPHLFVVSINGADREGDWNRLIQPLDTGNVDVASVLRTLKQLGYTGPIGLQHYGIGGDVRVNLKRSLDGWRKLSAEAAAR